MASRSASGRRPRPGPRPYGCRVKRIADSFTWPLRAPLSRWVFGILAVLLLPLLFIPLLGYAIAATRAAEQEPAQSPPAWSISGRLLAEDRKSVVEGKGV